MSIFFKHDNNKHEAFNIRANVFMVEQKFTYDFDTLDFDPDVLFITAYDDADPTKPIGTARVFPARLEQQYPEDLEAGDDSWVIGRIAVLPEARHMGLGSKLIVEAERLVKEMGAADLHLHAQVRAQDFYKANGYLEYGGLADDEGVPHQWMSKKLD